MPKNKEAKDTDDLPSTQPQKGSDLAILLAEDNPIFERREWIGSPASSP